MSKASNKKATPAAAGHINRLLSAAKARYTVAEVAPALAEALEISEAGAKARLYRALSDGRLRGVQYLGSLRLPRPEVERILRGEAL